MPGSRYFTRKKVFRLAVAFLGLAALLIVVAILPHRHKGSPRSYCIMNQRNLQQAVRALEKQENSKPGDPIRWEKIYGDKTGHYLSSKPVCPLGSGYVFATAIPETGNQVARCMHPEHQVPDTKDW